MSDKAERRITERAPYETEVQLAPADGTKINGVARDVGMTGIAVRSFASLPVGTNCDITISSTGRASWVSIRGKARVERVDGDGMALTFTELSREAMLILRCIVAQYEEMRTEWPREYLGEAWGEAA